MEYIDHDRTVFRTYIDGKLLYTGPELEAAIRAWDGATYNLGAYVAGGVSVAVYRDLGDYTIQMRDGWVLHVQENGVTYLNPGISLV